MSVELCTSFIVSFLVVIFFLGVTMLCGLVCIVDIFLVNDEPSLWPNYKLDFVFDLLYKAEVDFFPNKLDYDKSFTRILLVGVWPKLD